MCQMKKNCLADMSHVVSSSSVVDVPQLCANEQGDVFVSIYDFASFLARYFMRFDKIKQFHFFRFTASTSVKYKRFSNTDEFECDLAENTAHQLKVGDMPEVIVPAGLSAERQW